MREEFAEFILNMRTAAELTREDLAHHLCLSITTVEAYERGEKQPDNPEKFELYLRDIVKQKIRSKRQGNECVRYDLVG
jgi:DNA-binding transcriptional regulator YiaG